jgi:hypothetical protein
MVQYTRPSLLLSLHSRGCVCPYAEAILAEALYPHQQLAGYGEQPLAEGSSVESHSLNTTLRAHGQGEGGIWPPTRGDDVC